MPGLIDGAEADRNVLLADFVDTPLMVSLSLNTACGIDIGVGLKLWILHLHAECEKDCPAANRLALIKF